MKIRAGSTDSKRNRLGPEEGLAVDPKSPISLSNSGFVTESWHVTRFPPGLASYRSDHPGPGISCHLAITERSINWGILGYLTTFDSPIWVVDHGPRFPIA
jgi:hypothetical protein